MNVLTYFFLYRIMTYYSQRNSMITTEFTRAPDIQMTVTINFSATIMLAGLIIPEDIQTLICKTETMMLSIIDFNDVKFPKSLQTLKIIGKSLTYRCRIQNLILPEHIINLELIGVCSESSTDITLSPHLQSLTYKNMQPLSSIPKIPSSVKSYHLPNCSYGDLEDLPLDLEQLTIYSIDYTPTNLPPNLKSIILLPGMKREDTASRLTKLPFKCELIYA